MSPLVLLPADADPVPEEERGKGNLVSSRSPSGSKIVLTLLTEVVAVHVDFPQYTSGERGFNSFFRSSSEAAEAGAGAGAGAGARASRTALRIYCKSSSEYLGTLVVAAGDFGPGGPSGYSEISDPGGGEEPRRAIEGPTEGRSRQRRPRP